MKIIHVIDSLGIGGAELLLFNTIRLLPEHEHVLVTLIDLEQLHPEDIQLKKFICLNSRSKADWILLIYKIRKVINEYQPDLVHVHLQFSGLITKIACPKKIPLFYSLHSPYGPDGFSRNRYARLAENLTARKYHHLIGVSQLVLSDYRKYVSGYGTEDILYNFIPDVFFNNTPKPYVAGQQLKCISVGTLKRAKNYPYTLQQFVRLKHLPITLDIYGEGEDHAELQQYITDHALTNVRLMGRIEDIKTQLADYHLYITTSSYEGFGLAPLEAMAGEMPVIASDIPVFREVIGDAGMFISLEKGNQLADFLMQIFNGQMAIAMYGTLGGKRAKDIASAEKYKKKLLSIYKKY